MILSRCLTMKEIREQIEYAILRTPSSDKRNALCDANIMLGRAIELDEQEDGGVPAGTALSAEELSEVLLCVRRDAADQRNGARHPLTLSALRARLISNADRLDRIANKLEQTL